MTSKATQLPKRLLLSSAVAAALFAAPVAMEVAFNLDTGFIAAAHAEDDGDGPKGGKGVKGQGGPGDEQHGSGMGQGGVPKGPGAGSGQGGPSSDSEGEGPRANKPTGGDQGGQPKWAGEGIPDVELGRLNVARSPQHVLDRSLKEVLDNWDGSMESFYELTAEAAATLLSTQYDTVVRIDSPLENLALLQELLADGATQLPGVTPASKLDLAAILLGSASDKTLEVTEDTVRALAVILGVTLTDDNDPTTMTDEVSILADKAEAVRSAILTGHGE